MLLEWGKGMKKEHSEDNRFANLATMHEDKWWGKVCYPDRRWHSGRKMGKEILKKQGDEMLSGLPGWLCQDGYWKLGWKENANVAGIIELIKHYRF